MPPPNTASRPAPDARAALDAELEATFNGAPEPKTANATPKLVREIAARVCAETERAADAPGYKRFRVRALGERGNGGGALRSVGLYILAPDRSSAEACYLTAEAGELRAAGVEDPKKLVLGVEELVD